MRRLQNLEETEATKPIFSDGSLLGKKDSKYL